MKIRSDFVTNSSSSSFVIARKKECKQSDILELIDTKENRDIIEKESANFDEENTIEETLKNISSALFDGYNPIELDDWIVHAKYVTNEDELVNAIIYEGLSIKDNDIFKMKAYDA